jgi:magnesium transporter
VDEYEGQLFALLQMVYEDEAEEMVFEQVSLMVGKGFVITIQELPGRDVFDPGRQAPHGNDRNSGRDCEGRSLRRFGFGHW